MNGEYQGVKRLIDEVDHLSYIGQNNNDSSKKFKGDRTEAGPSKVVHIRNLPPTVIMAEVITLGAPFGRVDKHFLLREKGQALLQLDEVESAEAMINYYRQNPQFLHGKEIYVQFSHHQEIETNGSSGDGSSGEASTGNQTILRVVLQNPSYAVGLNVLFLIFSRFGKVNKIVTFTKNNQFQAFVQYSESKEAHTALTTLEREGSFAKIEYSKFSQLEVKENNEKSWDFTVAPTLAVRSSRGTAAVATGFEPLGLVANGLGLQLAYQPAPALTAAYAAAASPYGLAYPAAALQPQLKYPTAATPAALAAVATAPQSPVVLVSRLNDQMITPDALFTLFGVYGDVMRVKILFNNKGCALIQMREPHQVQLAIAHLNGVTLYGNQIWVSPSRHFTVQLPKEGHLDYGLTKDYSNSPLHRFKTPGSKNFHNIYPPSATLHLSNIPQSATEEELQAAFRAQDLSVSAFKFFPMDRRMALVQLASVEEAIIALIKMHDYKLSETNHLRVSFSKSTI